MDHGYHFLKKYVFDEGMFVALRSIFSDRMIVALRPSHLFSLGNTFLPNVGLNTYFPKHCTHMFSKHKF